MSFCSFVQKKQFTTDKLLLFLDKRTEEQKNSFYQTLYFHIPLLSFLFFCPQKIYSPYVLLFFCLKKLLFPILYVLMSKKHIPLMSFCQKSLKILLLPFHLSQFQSAHFLLQLPYPLLIIRGSTLFLPFRTAAGILRLFQIILISNQRIIRRERPDN